MGVDALLSGTLTAASKGEPGVRSALLDYGKVSRTFETDAGGVPLVNLRFSWKVYLPNNIFRLVLGSWLRLPALRRDRWIAEIDAADLCVALAGGDSFSDIYGFRRFLYVCLPQVLVLLRKKRLVLLPQTIGPFESVAARWLAGWITRRAERVHARDKASAKLADELLQGTGRKAGFTRDMAFALRPAEPRGGFPELAGRGPDARPLVGLNVSGLLLRGGYTGANMFGLRGDYAELMMAIATMFRGERFDAELLLISHVTGAGESDVEACRRIGEGLAERGVRARVADGGYDHREVKGLIGHCDFFLGSRMHACIAALSQGVPAVGLAYSRKFAGVFESIEVPELVVDLRERDPETVPEEIAKLYERRGELGRRLTDTAARARAEAEATFAGGIRA